MCQLAIALLVAFGLSGFAARVLGFRARRLRRVDAPPIADGHFYDPTAHTDRANELRRWSVWLTLVAFVCFLAFTLLVVLRHATCWPAL